MLQLLYPIGLLAAIGILVPIVIHLWNIKKGKTLKIGSIALLGLASNQRSSHLKITDWPLLLLRCLLLILIALVLGQPLYKSIVKPLQEPGLILLEKQELGRVWKVYKKEMDSLLKKGYEIRDLNVGFSKIELKDTATTFSRQEALPLSYFSLVRQLNAEKKPGTKVYLYTDNRLNRFEGMQPVTQLDLKWKILPVKDEEENKTTTNTGKDTDSDNLAVMIFSNGLHMDAAYIRSAVNAIADFTKRKITVKEIQSLQQIQKPTTLVFWLSEKPLNTMQLKQLPAGISFFNYAGQKTEKVKSAIHYESGAATQEIALYQRKKFDGKMEQSIWSDAFGVPLLTLDSVSGIKHYQFYSRFNQGWTDLVWSNGLVEALLPVVIPHQEAEFGYPEDQNAERIVSAIPLPLPNHTKMKASIFYSQQPIAGFIWWLLMLVFFMERWITYKKIEKKV